MANVVTPPTAHTATIVAVCTAERIAETSATLASLRAHSGVLTILISLGNDPHPRIEAQHDVVTIQQIVPRYLNNAVASLRLSSLPSIAWWRGGEVGLLPDLAALVDRLVLDALDPRDAWTLVPQLAPTTMIGDLRWTALTRWRNLMAQFFDVPGVRESIGSFSRLEISAGDVHAARLFAGWMTARLPEGATLATDISSAPRGMGMQSVTLSGAKHRLSLALATGSACIETSIEASGRSVMSRMVPLGAQTPEALMADELRVRARDVAFEEALRNSGELS
jgi:glucose-6-phosphate dehydrogenase assembly protein OpcA